jgi:hypothetical protein
VTKEASSEQSQATAGPISPGSPIRPSGAWAANCASTACGSSGPSIAKNSSTVGVRVGPGQTAFTRMPAFAYSSAAARVRPAIACLEAT